jgi:hypothetical protein
MRWLNITNNTTIDADAFYKYVRSLRNDVAVGVAAWTTTRIPTTTTRTNWLTCDYVYFDEYNEIIKKEDYDWLYKLIW